MNVPNKIPPWLNDAFSFLNEKEVKGKGTNPLIKAFFDKVSHPEITEDETPWCAAFVGCMLERSGIESTKSLRARSYLSWGRTLKPTKSSPTKPEPAKKGSIAVFRRGKNPKAGHVGFVVGETNTTLLILGGNQNDQVSIMPYSKSQLLGLRWPSSKTVKQRQSPEFKAGLQHVLREEGGWSHHSQDPGGATNYGITLRTFKAAIQKQIIAKPRGPLSTALKNISPSDVATIYHRLYWQKAHCAELSNPLGLIHFDAAVNHGVVRALKFLQKSVGAEVDGEWGPETQSKAEGANQQQAAQTYILLRKQHYQSLPTFNTFGRGWMNRLQNISKAASEARTRAVPNQQQQETQNMPTTHSQRKKWWAESLTIWGTIVTALSTILPLVGPLFGLDITSDMVEQFGASVTNLIQIIGGLTGTSMALYGRARAGTKLTRRHVKVKL